MSTVPACVLKAASQADVSTNSAMTAMTIVRAWDQEGGEAGKPGVRPVLR